MRCFADKYANELSEAETPCWVRSSTWGLRNSFLLQLPFWKFGMGCVSYLASVVLMSYRDLGPIPFWKWTALSIGVSPSPVQPRTVARGLCLYVNAYGTVYMYNVRKVAKSRRFPVRNRRFAKTISDARSIDTRKNA